MNTPLLEITPAAPCFIASVVPDGEEEAQCIRIAHPSRLYITDNLILTHNTYADASAESGNRDAPNSADDNLHSFVGQGAQTADTYALATAQQRLDAGEDAETVRQETGWFKGHDGKWRFEISDDEAIFNYEKWERILSGKTRSYALKNILHHREVVCELPVFRKHSSIFR